jgi:GT2 family glycosyltransferase
VLIAAVIVTFNRLDKLKLTVNKTLMGGVDHIIVVNNCSTDGTQKWLEDINDPRLQAIHLSKNTGGAGGFHVGFKEVVEHTDAQWIVCYDDDAYPADDFAENFRKLVPTLGDDIGGIGSAVYLPNGAIAEMNRPSRNPFNSVLLFIQAITKGRSGFHILDSDYTSSSPMDIDVASFVGAVIRTDLIRRSLISLPRKDLFIYGDDVLYMYSIREAGYRNVFIPQLRFYHDCVTLVNQQRHYYPLWKAYYTYRNGLDVYRHFSGSLFPLIAIVKIGGWLANTRYYPSKKTYLKCLFRAVWDGLRKDYSRSHDEITQLCA